MSEEQLAALAEAKWVSQLGFFDRAVTVASGTLVASVTFRSDIAGASPRALWLLVLCWFFLSVSCVLGCLLHLARARCAKLAISNLEAKYLGKERVGEPIGFADVFFGWAFVALLFCFPAGILALALFGALNVF